MIESISHIIKDRGTGTGIIVHHFVKDDPFAGRSSRLAILLTPLGVFWWVLACKKLTPSEVDNLKEELKKYRKKCAEDIDFINKLEL